jgi:hypothetical protein
LQNHHYPTEQLPEDSINLIGRHISAMAVFYDIHPDICCDLYRIGFEAGWEQALVTPGATRYRSPNSH